MSLADCFKKAGKALSGQDREAIEQLVADGMSEIEAVDSYLTTLDGQIQAVADQATKAGVTVAMDEPVVLEQQAQRSSLGLYSGVEKAVLEMKLPQWTPSKKNPDGSALGKDVWAKIKSSPIKKEEVEWLGVEEFLTADPRARFTRQEVADYIRSNGINIEEVVADRETGEGTEIEWNTPEVWDDPEAWSHRVEDMMYYFDNGDQDAIDEFSPQAWLLDNIDDVIANYQTSIPDLDEVVESEDNYGVLNYIESQGYDIFDDMSSDMRDAAEEAAEKVAEREYMDNPIYIRKSENIEDLIIFGSDDQGYDVRTSMMYSDIVRSDIWSESEAEIQAEDYAREEGLLSDEEDPSVAKWGEYVMDGYADNYREIKLTLPDIEGDFYNETHFPDRNLLAFLRVTDRDLETGVDKPQKDDFKSKHRIDFRFVDNPIEGAVHKRIVEVFDLDTGDVITTLAPGNKLTEFDFIEQAREKLANAEPGKKINNLETLGDGVVGIRKPPKRGGDNTYFIDEFQSDWHQDGRQKGYATGDRDDKSIRYRNLSAEITDQLTSTYDKYTSFAAKNDDYFLSLDAFVVALRNKSVNKDYPRSVSTLMGRTLNDFVEKQGVIQQFGEQLKQLNDAYLQLRVEEQGVPDAPFKGDAWIGLGLKRAIVDAAENGYESLAWPNSRVLMNRWSDRYEQLYRNQYDKKMSSIVKKLTKQQPKQFTIEGVPYNQSEEAYVFSDSFDTREKLESEGISNDSQLVTDDGKLRDGLQVVETVDGKWNLYDTSRTPEGYWIIPITDELRSQVAEKGLPLFQRSLNQDSPRGTIKLLPGNQRIIQLSQASDPSTFLHEAGHLFLEMEKQFAAEFGVSEDQQTILDWMGVKSFDDIGVEQHEKWAETFEVYLQEGKAPSLKLRDVFAAFHDWLTSVYRWLDPRTRAELTPEIREVFDRLLATEEEIEAASNNPAFDQFFKSKEQAGMTDQEWEDYQKQKQRAKNKAQSSIDQKIIDELRRRKTAEWKAEKAPIVEEEKERLSKLPVYQILSDAGTPDGMMDYDMVKELNGGKMPGNMVGKARKGGIDPAEYAEVYGYPSADEMIKAIVVTPALNKMADEAAENRMLDKYGDILNDGTIEREAREAIHNDDQARLLLTELKALGRKVGAREGVNREYLKAQSKTMIGSMTYAKIKPSKFYRAEIRAAQKAINATNEQEAYEAKIQQIANHYLYRESVLTRDAMDRQRKYVRRVQTKKYNEKQVHPSYISKLKMVANMYDLRSNPERVAAVSDVINWYQGQISGKVPDLSLIDEHLILALAAKEDSADNQVPSDTPLPTFNDLTAEQLRGLYDQLRHLRYLGGQLSDEVAFEAAKVAEEAYQSIIDNGGRDKKGTRGIPGKREEQGRQFDHLVNKLPNLMNMVRKLDGFTKDGQGVMFNRLYQRVVDGNNRVLELEQNFYDKFKSELKGITDIGLTRNDSKTYRLHDGRDFSIHTESRFVMGLYWGIESSREAIRQGYGMTDADVQMILSDLTNDQLDVMQAVWDMNESVWPMLADAGVKRYGVVSPKLDAAPFTINGRVMKGGHLRLFYDSTRVELKNEQEAASKTMEVMPNKAASLHSRVGSGGMPPLLDVNNITRALDESIHFIAFAEPAADIRRIVNDEKIKGAIERKHGVGFYRAFVESIDSVTGNRRAKEILPKVSGVLRHLRKAVSYQYIVLNVRNVLDQVSALPIAVNEVGGAAFTETASRIISDPDLIDWIKERSSFMDNRASVVNKTAADYLRKLSVGDLNVPVAPGKSYTVPPKIAKAYRYVEEHGFVMQTQMDALLAYPVWLAKYEQSIAGFNAENPNADEKSTNAATKIAITLADQAVAESVGSGSNIHLGGLYQSSNNEWVQFFTMMGSWFNNQYNRIYRDTKGFTSFDNKQAIMSITAVPIFSALLSAAIRMDGPDEDEESWIEWGVKQWGMFLAAMVPGLRDVAAANVEQRPVRTVYESAIQTPTRFFSEFKAYSEDRQTGLKTSADLISTTGTLVPLPGSGNISRFLDYVDSYNRGLEGDVFNPYQALVEGSDKNDKQR